MSISRLESRIIGMHRALGRMRGTVSHVIMHAGKVDKELAEMAKKLDALRRDLPREHKKPKGKG